MESAPWALLFMGFDYHHWYVIGSRVPKISDWMWETLRGPCFHCQNQQGFTRGSMGTQTGWWNQRRCPCPKRTRGSLMERTFLRQNKSPSTFDHRYSCANLFATYWWKLLLLLRNYHFQISWAYWWVWDVDRPRYSELLLHYYCCYGRRQNWPS